MMTRSMRLHEAAGRGDVKAIRTIASFGFDLNAQNLRSVRPIHRASWKGEIGAIKALVELGADPEALDREKCNAIHYAAVGNSARAINLLAELEVNPNQRDALNEVPLHPAARKHAQSAAEALLALDVEVDVQNLYGDTPLHIAVGNGDVNFVRLLREKGASIHLRNEDPDYYETPEEMAKRLLTTAENSHPFHQESLDKVIQVRSMVVSLLRY